MAAISFSVSRSSLDEGGYSAVTEGTLAPNAGDVEDRISAAGGVTKLELEEMMDRIWRFASDPNASTSVPNT